MQERFSLKALLADIDLDNGIGVQKLLHSTQEDISTRFKKKVPKKKRTETTEVAELSGGEPTESPVASVQL